MVLIFGGNSEIGARVRINLCNLICLRHFIRSRDVTNQFFFLEKTYFLSCVRNMCELPSNISTMEAHFFLFARERGGWVLCHFYTYRHS